MTPSSSPSAHSAPSPSRPLSWGAAGTRRQPLVVVATVLGAVSIVLLASCSGASPKVGKSGSPSSSTTTATVAACSASSVSASVDFTTFGGSSTSPAGAVVFDNTSGNSCSLRGIPTIELVGADGQVIPSFPAPSSPAHDGTAVLTPGGKPAASSITWSSLTCLAGSYSLAVTFPGWSSSVPAGSTAGYQGPACTVTGTTVYVSPVELITAPSSTSSTTTTSG